jgi:broad specificity phosphatase PhoE
MKTIYLVRHGESVYNVATHFEKRSAPLTDHGRAQAHAAGIRLSAVSAQVIIASPIERAHETANIIAKQTHLTVETSDLFIERSFPAEIMGLPKDDTHAMRIEDQWSRSLDGRAEWDGAGDSYDTLKERADAAVAYLENRPESTIILVTHGYFMRVLFARILLGEQMTREQFAPFAWGLRVENASVSRIIYDPEDDAHWSLWHVDYWSDSSHLKGI